MNSGRSYNEEMEERYERFKQISGIPDDFKYCYSGSSSSDSDLDFCSSQKAIESANKVETSKDNKDVNQKDCEKNVSAISKDKAPGVIVPVTRRRYSATPDYQCNIVRCSRKFMSRGSLNKHSDFDFNSRQKAIESANKVEISKDNEQDGNQKDCEKNVSAISEDKAPGVIVPVTRSGYSATPDYQCNIVRCSRKFMSRGSLNKHLKLHAEVSRKYVCIICSMRFKTKKTLSCHYTQAHGKDYDSMKKIKLSCDACKKEFDDHECYNRHMKNHIALNQPKPFKCTKCLMKYSTIMALISHSQNKHLDSSSISCSVCKKRFRTHCDMEQHIKIHSTNLRKLKCTGCNK